MAIVLPVFAVGVAVSWLLAGYVAGLTMTGLMLLGLDFAVFLMMGHDSQPGPSFPVVQVNRSEARALFLLASVAASFGITLSIVAVANHHVSGVLASFALLSAVLAGGFGAFLLLRSQEV